MNLPPREKLEIFAWWVNYFMKEGQTYSKQFFIGDHPKAIELIMLDGSKVPIADDDSDDDSD